MRVLVTGAAGSVGTVVTAGLRILGHVVTGLDLRPAEPPVEGDVVADLLVPGVAAAAVHGVDAVVHLAGIPTEASLPQSLESHVHTTARLLEAMVGSGPRRFVYASSNHAVGFAPRTGTLTVDALPRPDTFYGVGKVAAEALCRLYADRHGIEAVCCRIGSFLPRPTSRRALSTWLSHNDAVRMVQAALTAPDPGFQVIYGISANTRAWWDLAPGRALGYHPLDDAEEYAAEVTAIP
ncbi:MAG: NAD(P)-dependent oxidoreductase, partial [Actinomycetota bacterium]|nr:NAD(P)-dependent oxidoreductase [Actinomycetota bacterium]